MSSVSSSFCSRKVLQKTGQYSACIGGWIDLADSRSSLSNLKIQHSVFLFLHCSFLFLFFFLLLFIFSCPSVGAQNSQTSLAKGQNSTHELWVVPLSKPFAKAPAIVVVLIFWLWFCPYSQTSLCSQDIDPEIPQCVCWFDFLYLAQK